MGLFAQITVLNGCFILMGVSFSGWAKENVSPAPEFKPTLDEDDLRAIEERLRKYAEATEKDPPESKPVKPSNKKGTGKRSRKNIKGFIQRLDVDGDGKLNEAERKRAYLFFKKLPTQKGPFAKKMLEKFDKNKDGNLQDSEREKALLALEKVLVRKVGIRNKRIKKFDKDGDGKLNEEERGAMKRFLDTRKNK